MKIPNLVIRLQVSLNFLHPQICPFLLQASHRSQLQVRQHHIRCTPQASPSRLEKGALTMALLTSLEKEITLLRVNIKERDARKVPIANPLTGRTVHTHGSQILHQALLPAAGGRQILGSVPPRLGATPKDGMANPQDGKVILLTAVNVVKLTAVPLLSMAKAIGVLLMVARQATTILLVMLMVTVHVVVVNTTMIVTTLTPATTVNIVQIVVTPVITIVTPVVQIVVMIVGVIVTMTMTIAAQAAIVNTVVAQMIVIATGATK